MSNLPDGVTQKMIDREVFGSEGQRKYLVTVVYTVYAENAKEAEQYALTGDEYDHEVLSVELDEIYFGGEE